MLKPEEMKHFTFTLRQRLLSPTSHCHTYSQQDRGIQKKRLGKHSDYTGSWWHSTSGHLGTLCPDVTRQDGEMLKVCTKTALIQWQINSITNDRYTKKKTKMKDRHWRSTLCCPFKDNCGLFKPAHVPMYVPLCSPVSCRAVEAQGNKELPH